MFDDPMKCCFLKGPLKDAAVELEIAVRDELGAGQMQYLIAVAEFLGLSQENLS